ncbi:SAM-dependent methyltransferase [Pedobacter sp. SYSU D00535]|uniref:SAM-dependent methyltransferase n=1 Tax=Pedobacter sp. SYSU D00535 TaxID=2810308 RepID=UPI001A97B3B1|nr:SAM-dependent methyltransferase [Pedobacter sp. SYSU D00535]
MPKGTLFLIPVPLAENSAEKVLTIYQQELINNIRTYIVENEKTARYWLKNMKLQVPQSELNIHVYGKHSEKVDIASYFKELEAGQDVGLMSEAGCPAVADPGSDVVAEAHRRGIKVVPNVGPSSILLALMGSGFNGQSFTFHGYLPIDKGQRSKRIKELEAQSERQKQTQIFIETPFRNNQMLEELLRTCSSRTKLCVAVNLTGEDEQIISQPVEQWRKLKVDFHKKPAIFLLFK